MKLGALGQHDIGQGDADAAAKVAGDIHQSGGLIGFVRRQAVIGHGVDWNEHEGQSDGLINAHPGEVIEARVGCERGRVPHRQRDAAEP